MTDVAKIVKVRPLPMSLENPYNYSYLNFWKKKKIWNKLVNNLIKIKLFIKIIINNFFLSFFLNILINIKIIIIKISYA